MPTQEEVRLMFNMDASSAIKSMQSMLTEMKRLNKEIQAGSTATSQATESTKQQKVEVLGLQGAISRMNVGWMQASYAIGDASAMIQNFRMGLMGISNNIPMIVQQFMSAQNVVRQLNAELDAGAKKFTMGQVLAQSFKGLPGVIVMVNMLTTGIQALFAYLSSKKEGETTNKVKNYFEEAQEALEKFRNAHGEYAEDIGKSVNESIKIREAIKIFNDLKEATSRTNIEQKAFQGTINYLTKTFPEFGKSVDVFNSSLSVQNDWISKISKSWKDYITILEDVAKVEAIRSQISDVVNKQVAFSISDRSNYNDLAPKYLWNEKRIETLKKILKNKSIAMGSGDIRESQGGQLGDLLVIQDEIKKLTQWNNDFLAGRALSTLTYKKFDKSIKDISDFASSSMDKIWEGAFAGDAEIKDSKGRTKVGKKPEYTYKPPFDEFMEQMKAATLSSKEQVGQSFIEIDKATKDATDLMITEVGNIADKQNQAIEIVRRKLELNKESLAGKKDIIRNYLNYDKQVIDLDLEEKNSNPAMSDNRKNINKAAAELQAAKDVYDIYVSQRLVLNDSLGERKAAVELLIKQKEYDNAILKYKFEENKKFDDLYDELYGKSGANKYDKQRHEAEKAYKDAIEKADKVEYTGGMSLYNFGLYVAKIQQLKNMALDIETETKKAIDRAEALEKQKAMQDATSYLSKDNEFAKKRAEEDKAYFGVIEKLQQTSQYNDQIGAQLAKQHTENVIKATAAYDMWHGAMVAGLQGITQVGNASLQIFKKQHSMLQTLINDMALYMIQWIETKMIIEPIASGVGGFFAGLLGGIGASLGLGFLGGGASAATGGAGGSGGLGELLAIKRNVVTPNNMYNFSKPSTIVNVQGEFKLSGRDLKAVLANEDRHRSLYE